MSNVIDAIAADINLVAMRNAVMATELRQHLSAEGPFTVFAPTDMAFGKMQTGRWPQLLKEENKAELTGMLNDYLVEGRTQFRDFVDGQKLQSVGGRELTVHVFNGNVDIGGARIMGRDMDAENGVVHSLDRVFVL